MASTACSSCQAHVAVDKCTFCNSTLCAECLVRCRVCKRVVCDDHFDVTDGGRRLCTECMRKRAIAKAERRERKERERQKETAAPMSFEALSEELGPGPGATPAAPPVSAEPEEPAAPAETSFDALSAEEAAAPAVDEVAAPKSTNYQADSQTVRLPIDENRPILTGSSPKPWPRWVYLFPLAFAIALGYWIVSKLMDAAVYF